MNTEPFHTTHAVRGSPQKLKAGISMINGAQTCTHSSKR